MDNTHNPSINGLKESILGRWETGLDIMVINNAALYEPPDLENFAEQTRKIFEINYYGYRNVLASWPPSHIPILIMVLVFSPSPPTSLRSRVDKMISLGSPVSGSTRWKMSTSWTVLSWSSFAMSKQTGLPRRVGHHVPTQSVIWQSTATSGKIISRFYFLYPHCFQASSGGMWPIRSRRHYCKRSWTGRDHGS